MEYEKLLAVATVAEKDAVQKLQTEGGVLTPKVNAQDLRTARFVLLKRFVTSLDEAQASNPAVLLEAPAP